MGSDDDRLRDLRAELSAIGTPPGDVACELACCGGFLSPRLAIRATETILALRDQVAANRITIGQLDAEIERLEGQIGTKSTPPANGGALPLAAGQFEEHS